MQSGCLTPASKVIPGLAKREPGTQGIVERNACGPWFLGSAFGRPGMTELNADAS